MTLPRILNRLVSRLLAAETRAIRLRPDLGWQLALPPGAEWASTGRQESQHNSHNIND